MRIKQAKKIIENTVLIIEDKIEEKEKKSLFWTEIQKSPKEESGLTKSIIMTLNKIMKEINFNDLK